MLKSQNESDGMERLDERSVLESSHGQANVEETNTFNKNSYELIEVRNVEGTPFELVKTKQVPEPDNTFIRMGAVKLTPYMSEDNAMEEINERSWLLFQAMAVAVALQLINKKEK